MPVGKPDNPYRESEDHVPDPTHVVDVLDTTGLGGNSRMQDVTPIFSETARRDLVEAADVLESGDPLRQGNVILPDPIYPELRREARQSLLDRAAEHREGDYVSPAETQARNFERGAAPAGGDRIFGLTPAGTGSGTTERPSEGNTQLAGAPEGSGVRVALERQLDEDGDSGTSPSSTSSAGDDQSTTTTVPTPGATSTVTSTGEDGEDEQGDGKYADLLAKGNEDVQKYMDEHPDEADAVKAAERARKDGKPVRAGIVNYRPRS
jgi:hypothetical protein